jgi:hypothetical protein
MAAPSIEGTYRLIRRVLPDGTVQSPPAVQGMITYTKEFRNFSAVWKDGKGRFYSECYVARYTLTEKEYKETAVGWVERSETQHPFTPPTGVLPDP